MYANISYIFENCTPVWTFWRKNWIHMCTHSRNTQFLLNKFQFFINKKFFSTKHFLFLRPSLLNKISFLGRLGTQNFKNFISPKMKKIEILFSKPGLRIKKVWKFSNYKREQYLENLKIQELWKTMNFGKLFENLLKLNKSKNFES